MIPVLGALILQAMYGAVDILVVGRFGSTEGISGVSTGSSIVNMVVFAITGLTTGLTIRMSTFHVGWAIHGCRLYLWELHVL